MTANEYMKKIKDNLDSVEQNLEQIQCDDAISRQAVIEYINRILNQGTGKKKSFDFIQKYVEKLPSVKQEPKTGHWIAEENEEMETIGYYCSECDLPMETENQTRFCPNCGARMESEE